jgi:ubiquinone biosynthesis protein
VKYITRFFRLLRINFILMRYNLDGLLLSTSWFSPIRYFSYANPMHWVLKNKLSRGQRIRLALEDLGPIFIKAGQVLSTRRDLLPDDIAEELAKLQDRVPPFSGTKAQEIIEEALGQRISDVFAQFDTQALASASIAQVHAATLLDGKASRYQKNY